VRSGEYRVLESHAKLGTSLAVEVQSE